MNWENSRVLILSPEKWGQAWVSKHHYAYELTKQGASVLFVNPPGEKWKAETPMENIKVISYRHTRGLNKSPEFLRDFINMKLISKLYDFAEIDKPDVIWSFDPFRFQNLKLFKARKAIYHLVDKHHISLEKSAVTSADLALATSKTLINIRDYSKVKVIGHGVSGKFQNQNKILNGNGKLNAGYIGNLQSQWLDLELVEKAIRSFPTIQFNFAGPDDKTKSTVLNSKTIFNQIRDRYDNVNLLGPINEELPRFLSSMDLLLLFYKKIDGSYPANSHKILEYLSSGKTILSLPIIDYQERKDLIEFSNSHQEYIQKLHEIVDNLDVYNSARNQKLRKEFASQFTYEKQLKQISELLNDCQK
jgi:hypothetical protein